MFCEEIEEILYGVICKSLIFSEFGVFVRTAKLKGH